LRGTRSRGWLEGRPVGIVLAVGVARAVRVSTAASLTTTIATMATALIAVAVVHVLTSAGCLPVRARL
jgi:hypothetical protein